MIGKSLKKYFYKITYTPLGDKFYAIIGLQKYMAYRLVKSLKKRLLNEAKKEFEKGPTKGSFDDYKNALEKHWVSFSEYSSQYEFYKLTEAERDSYISRLKMKYLYTRYFTRVAIPVFFDKIRFLKTFDKFVRRKWIYAPETNIESFAQLLSNYDCIVKPTKGSLGQGIFKIKKNSDSEKIKELFNLCVTNKLLVEQCIESCEELKQFHPQSLNTLRVVTIANNSKAQVIGSFFRMGIGDSVIDNAHAGGVFAQIDIKNGVIESDGIDVNGNKYIIHPDSGIKLKGFKIPKWNAIVDTCCEAARQTRNPITGWDVVINSEGKVEFIEGNCNPDFDVMQSPLKIGIKKDIYSLIKDYCGIELK